MDRRVLPKECLASCTSIWYIWGTPGSKSVVGAVHARRDPAVRAHGMPSHGTSAGRTQGVCESAPGRFAPSEAAVTGRGRVVLALTSHRDERSTTAQHQTASSSDLQGRSRWPDGIVMSLLMTTAAHAGSGTPGSRGLGPVHSAPRGWVLNARAPLSHLDRVDCPAIPSLLAHADH